VICPGLTRVIEHLRKRAIRRGAVDDDNGRCTHQVAERREVAQRIVVELAQQRVDQKRRRDDKERGAIRRRPRHRLGTDRAACSRPVFDDHGRTAGAPGLVRQEPRDDIGGAAGRVRNDDPDGS